MFLRECFILFLLLNIFDCQKSPQELNQREDEILKSMEERRQQHLERQNREREERHQQQLRDREEYEEFKEFKRMKADYVRRNLGDVEDKHEIFEEFMYDKKLKRKLQSEREDEEREQVAEIAPEGIIANTWLKREAKHIGIDVMSLEEKGVELETELLFTGSINYEQRQPTFDVLIRQKYEPFIACRKKSQAKDEL